MWRFRQVGLRIWRMEAKIVVNTTPVIFVRHTILLGCQTFSNLKWPYFCGDCRVGRLGGQILNSRSRNLFTLDLFKSNINDLTLNAMGCSYHYMKSGCSLPLSRWSIELISKMQLWEYFDLLTGDTWSASIYRQPEAWVLHEYLLLNEP